jgi:hypothetical protein
MPIRFPSPPEAAAGAEGTIPPQPVYTVGLDELGATGVAEESATRPPSWRVSRFDADGRSEVVEVREDATAPPVSAGDDRFGPLIREALGVAGEDDRVEAGDYEARLYRVPALTLLALWLHSPTSVDLFVPVGPAPPGLERNRVYEDPDFTAAVNDAAASQREAYDAAENTDELGS